MLSNLNSTTLPENVSASQPVLLQPLPTLNESEELKQIAEKRALVIGRLNTAKLCEIIGKNHGFRSQTLRISHVSIRAFLL